MKPSELSSSYYDMDAARRRGHEDGKKGIPTEDNVGLGQYELELRAFYESEMDSCKQELEVGLRNSEKQIAYQLRKKPTYDENPHADDGSITPIKSVVPRYDENPDYEITTKRAQGELGQIVKTAIPVLEDLQRKAQEATDDYGDFREKYGLKDTPAIPGNKRNSFFWIVVFFVAESVLNGFFLKMYWTTPWLEELQRQLESV